MIGTIVEFTDLQRLCRPGDTLPSRATVCAWLKQRGIPYLLDLHNGPFTTLEAINAAMGVRGGGTQYRDRPEDLI